MVSPRHILNTFGTRYSDWATRRALDRRIIHPKLGPRLREGRRILFFAPEAGLAPHFHMMCVLAKTLQEQGHDVWLGSCFNGLARCPVMGAHQAPMAREFDGRENICRDCLKSSIHAVNSYGLKTFDFSTLDGIRLQERQDKVLASLPDDLYSFEYDGIEFGNLCVFEVCLGTKQTTPDGQVKGVPFPQHHTSDDNASLISEKSLATSALIVQRILNVWNNKKQGKASHHRGKSS